MRTVETTFCKLNKGQAGKFYKEIAEHLDTLEPLAISTIILKVTFDRVSVSYTHLTLPTIRSV